MPQLKFRDATITDLPAIVAIYNSTIPGRMVTADLEPVSVESKLAWFYEHSSKKRPLWIVENENGETIGWISFQDFYGRPAYAATAEISIYLDEKFRGQGYGKQALQYSLNHCAGLGISTLLGYIFAHNQHSLKLFYQAGFKGWATLPNIAVLDGIERSLIIVGKRIG